jgi:hypothetical protein
MYFEKSKKYTNELQKLGGGGGASKSSKSHLQKFMYETVGCNFGIALCGFAVNCLEFWN